MKFVSPWLIITIVPLDLHNIHHNLASSAYCKSIPGPLQLSPIYMLLPSRNSRLLSYL